MIGSNFKKIMFKSGLCKKSKHQPVWEKKECCYAKMHPNNRTQPSKRLGTINSKGTFWYFKKTPKCTSCFQDYLRSAMTFPPRLLLSLFVTWPCTVPTCYALVSITGCPWPVMCTERRTENSSNTTYLAWQQARTGNTQRYCCCKLEKVGM